MASEIDRAARVYSPVRLSAWAVAGALGGAAVYAGAPAAIAVGLALLVAAALATATRRVGRAFPAYLLGAGVAGAALSLTLSPKGVLSIGTSGHSAVCSSAGGCVGQSVSQAEFALPAVTLFGLMLLVGLVWLGLATVAARAKATRP